MLTKKKINEQIKTLSSEFTLEELIEHLIFVNKVEERIRQSENNEFISSEELDRNIEEWSK